MLIPRICMHLRKPTSFDQLEPTQLFSQMAARRRAPSLRELRCFNTSISIGIPFPVFVAQLL
jgi:hypothetical protein